MGEYIRVGQLSLPDLARKHSEFALWEFDARGNCSVSCPAEFDIMLFFAALDRDEDEPWVYDPGTGSGTEKREIAWRKFNTTLWAVLIGILRKAISKENDGAATLKWRLFFDDIYKATTIDKVNEDGEVYRKVIPEHNGQFLWCKMRAHVLNTSQGNKHAAMKSFPHIRLKGDKILEFFSRVEDIGEQAGFDRDVRFLHIKDALLNSSTFRSTFLTWQLTNPLSIDTTYLREFYTIQESQKNNRFVSGDGDRDHRSRNWGTAGTEHVPEDWDDDSHDWYNHGAAGDLVFDSDEDDLADDECFWDATTEREVSWQTWNAYWETPEYNFATAGRFKGRKGKGKGKKGFQRFTPFRRKGKGGGKSKGWSPYGGKGKGVAAPTAEEDYDPVAHYWPESDNPLDHFYWDAEYAQAVYDPIGETPTAAAAKQGRKGKSGKKGGKGKHSNKKGPSGEACIQWGEFRCRYGDKCRHSHSAPGGLAPKEGGKKGAAAPNQQPSGTDWSQSPSGQQQMPSGIQGWPSGAPGNQAVPSGWPSGAQQSPSGHGWPSGAQHGWPSGAQQMPSGMLSIGDASAAAARRAPTSVVGFDNATPDERRFLAAHLSYLRSSQTGASAVPNFGSYGPPGKGFSC